MSEDIHDLFGRDEAGEEEAEAEERADESVDAAEEPDEPGDGSDGSTASTGFPSLGDGDEESTGQTAPSGSETAESTASATGLDVDDDADESEMDWSTSSSEEPSADDGGFESAGSTSDDSATSDDDGPADDAFELSESTGESPGRSREEAGDDFTGAESRRESNEGNLGETGEEEPTDEPQNAAGSAVGADEGATGSAGGGVVPGGRDREGSRPERTTAGTGGIAETDVDDDPGEDAPTEHGGTSSTAATREPAGRGADEFDSAGSTTDAGAADDGDGVSRTGPKTNAPDGQDDGIEVEPDAAGSSDRSTASGGGLASDDTDASGSAVTGQSGDASEAGPGGSEPDSATASSDAAEAGDPGVGESGATGSSSSGAAATDRGDAESHGATTTTDSPSVDDGGSATVKGSAETSGSASSDSDDDERPTMPASGSNRLSTGIDALDEVMGGGVPPGRMIVLVADPGVQSELIVDSVLAQRDTLYVTTDRPDWEVQKDIEPGLGSGEVEIRDHTPDSLLLGVDTLLDEIETSSNFVLDSVNELELVPRQRYRIFLSDVKRRLFDTGSVGLLTGVTVDHESARDLTLRRADIVWRLETRTTGKEIVNLLSVPKFRGGAAVTETVKLELTDEVRVDPSWNGE